MSKIEELIDEIEQYIDSCKYQIMSNTNIIVNKDEIDALLRELRLHTPDEIRRYQKIVSNREGILQAARDEAQKLIDDAASQTKELLSEHEILQQAQMRADAMVNEAVAQAQEIVDDATNEANAVRAAAIQYTDDILGNLEAIMKDAQNIANEHYGGFLSSIRENLEVVSANRAELRSESPAAVKPAEPSGGDDVSVDLI